jgi:hypothetical protein
VIDALLWNAGRSGTVMSHSMTCRGCRQHAFFVVPGEKGTPPRGLLDRDLDFVSRDLVNRKWNGSARR